jgi:uncharacterized protein
LILFNNCMHYHIILTNSCDSKCSYCYGKSMCEFENNISNKFKFVYAPLTSKLSMKLLKRFISKDKKPVLIFYGGEPLLNIRKIKSIINKLPNVKFRMQTNAKLLNNLPIEYLKKIDKILVSIDGDKDITDTNRGEGTYDLVIKNLKNARKLEYKGEIVARMVITPPNSDIYQQLNHLLSLNLFDSIHWQIDAGFYTQDYNKIKFSRFVEEYNKSIEKLIELWLSKLKEGKVIMLYPFIQIMQDLLLNKKSLLRCGAGHKGYTISTDGNIYACPIAHDIEEFKAGDLNDSPNSLKKFNIKGECLSCNILDICGGRCLYWNYSNLWPKEGDIMICETIRNLINKLIKIKPQVNKLIDKRIISINDFNHEKYFGPEIIP